MRVLVTGSRTWTDVEAIRDALDTLANTARELQEPLTVVHGACPGGVDRIADDWARGRGGQGWPVRPERHPADWHTYGKRAGFLRNQAMVRLGADVCLAFVAPCEKPRCRKPMPHGSHGASDCADLAEAADIRTERFVVRVDTPAALLDK